MSFDLLLQNLMAPAVLAFLLGVTARVIRSDLALPDAIRSYLSIFLLLSIGLKGGAALSGAFSPELMKQLGFTVLAGIGTTLTTFWVARHLLKDQSANAGALAAHYGSASAVTFIAAQQFAEKSIGAPEGVLVLLLVALEVPALVIGVALGRGAGLSFAAFKQELIDTLRGKTAVLLLGGVVIGALAGKGGLKSVDNMYFELFQGMLMLFLIDLGMVAANHLLALDRRAFALVAVALLLPVLHGAFGVWLGGVMGLGPAGATVFAAMLSSASYIAAPAAIQHGLPEADAGRCITAALGVTFPFNLAVGIPIYAFLAQHLSS
jgi:hypothetical protein